MDAKFRPAIAAIKGGDIDELKALLRRDPTLATSRSSTGHPTLLQCLTLDGRDVSNKVEMARVLVEAGAEINGPLCACASMDNVEVAAALLDAGALIDGTGGWSPLEEALYWRNQGVIDLLVKRGALLHNLRIAAGLGRLDLIHSFFDHDGNLKPEAGKIDWPFGDPLTGKFPKPIKEELQAKFTRWSDQPRNVINNAFIYACIHNRIEAATLLLQKGADINAIPPGFDYAGTGLHNAAVHGHREMVDFLIAHGADATIKDEKVQSSPAGWANYGGHTDLRDYLEQVANEQSKKQTEER
ncbi:MAG TPA: ankyrin repeat domain-containing protein [Blastocatellia bacterium]|nr:ankyrin repeat domain-containing protein [Blastocatellia bacterium]